MTRARRAWMRFWESPYGVGLRRIFGRRLFLFSLTVAGLHYVYRFWLP